VEYLRHHLHPKEKSYNSNFSQPKREEKHENYRKIKKTALLDTGKRKTQNEVDEEDDTTSKDSGEELYFFVFHEREGEKERNPTSIFKASDSPFPHPPVNPTAHYSSLLPPPSSMDRIFIFLFLITLSLFSGNTLSLFTLPFFSFLIDYSRPMK